MRFLIRLYIVSLFILTLDLFNHEGKKSCMIIFTQAQFANLKIHDKKNQTAIHFEEKKKIISLKKDRASTLIELAKLKILKDQKANIIKSATTKTSYDNLKTKINNILTKNNNTTKTTITTALPSTTTPLSSISKTQKTVNAHKVSEGQQQEIINFSGSNIPREIIQNHISNHFPEKSAAEINDIIIASNSAKKRMQPKENDMKKENINKAKKNTERFAKAKDLFSKIKNQIIKKKKEIDVV